MRPGSGFCTTHTVARFAAASWLACAPLSNSLAAGCSVPPVTITHTDAAVKSQLVYSLGAYPQAICNYGDPAAYIFRPGSGAGLHRWIIHLHGGGQCNDDTSCSTRPKSLTRNTLPIGEAGEAMDGLLSSNAKTNPDFYDANAVEVEYCSSDFWAGSRFRHTQFDQDHASTTWSFAGHAIALAAVQDLLANHGLARATEVLLTGSSAGGVGITLNANAMMPLLPVTSRTLLANDAGYSLDIGAFDPNARKTNYVSKAKPTPGETILLNGHDLWSGSGDAICAQAAVTLADKIKCMASSYVISEGYLPAPLAVFEALDDHAQLDQDGLTPIPPDPGTPAATYATAFAAAMKCDLVGGDGCKWPGAGALNSVYAPYAIIHTMLTTTKKGDNVFDTAHVFPDIGKLTPRRAIGAWYQDPCTAEQLVGDTLEGPKGHHGAVGNARFP